MDLIRLLLLAVVASLSSVPLTGANPDAKRLYDDLLSTYNRLIRPVSNNTHTVLVKLGLRLSQLIELVSIQSALNSYKNVLTAVCVPLCL